MDAHERELTDAILDAALWTARLDREIGEDVAKHGHDHSAYLDAAVVHVAETRRAFGEALAAWFAFKVGQCRVIKVRGS